MRQTLAVIAIAAVLWFGWPTPYQRLPMQPAYARAGILDVRAHRVTGRISALTARYGWQELRTPYERARARVSADQR